MESFDNPEIIDYLARHDYYVQLLNQIEEDFKKTNNESEYNKNKTEFYERILKLIKLEKGHKKGKLSRLLDGDNIKNENNNSGLESELTICDKNIDGA